MKSLQVILIAFIVSTFTFMSDSNAQTSRNKQKLEQAPEETFFSIQQSFNDYWAPYNVDKNGYYEENGERKKAAGWKQFKRWEYYWTPRVDPTTGAFPRVNSSIVFAEREIRKTGGRNATGNWTSMGPSTTPGGYSGLGRLNCVAFRPADNNTIYTGSPSGGLWKTTDGGSNWIVLTDQNAVLGVSDAVVIAGATPANDIIYIGTGDRDGGSMWSLGGGQSNDNNSIGVLKSTDGGTSWSATGLVFSPYQKEVVNRMLLDPTDNDVIYVATSLGLFKTTNAGINWSSINSTAFIDIKFKPGDSQTIYASSTLGRIYRSTNGGASWSIEFDDYASGARRIDLAVSADEPTWVYAVIGSSSSELYGVYKSTDSGASFNVTYNGPNLLGWDCSGGDSGGQSWYDLTIAADPNDASTVFIGGVNTWRSTDGGVNWTISNHWTGSCGATAVHADQHFLAYQNGTSNLFECNDGGLYKSTNGGSSWTHIGNGMAISQMYRLGTAQTTSNDVIAGLQDNGTKAMLSGTWDDVKGGDGMDCMIDYTDETVQYGESQYGGLARTTNHWSSYTTITSGISGSPWWVMPINIDPNVHTTIYAATQYIFKSTNRGTSWTQIGSWSSSSIKEMAIAPSNSNYIYATNQSEIQRTTDGGTNWTDITGSLPVGSSSITYIAVKDDDPNTVWVSMGQYNTNGVYQTTNGGTSWTNISTGIPSIPVMCVVQNKMNTSQVELYAGTDVGVYVKLGGSNWELFSDGLPNVVVNELKIFYNSSVPGLSRLRAATSGRGMWESELYSPPAQPPVANFYADDTNPGVGQTVTFTDASTNVPISWAWSFTPSSVTFIGGTNASSQNPQVQFNTVTDYTVELNTSNAYGSDAENKSDYISISPLLTYCAASGGGDEYIMGVELESIENTGTSSDGYANYTNLSADLIVNQTYTLSIANGNYYSSDDLGVWIDWNTDGDFDDTGEEVVCTGNDGASGDYSITVPHTAPLGVTTMRIRMKWSGDDCGSPCGTTTYGEVEDYKIVVMPGLNTWLGHTTVWNTASNWSDGEVPTSSYNVTIPLSPVGGNFPLIPTGNNAHCNDIMMHDNAQIIVNGTLSVGGD